MPRQIPRGLTQGLPLSCRPTPCGTAPALGTHRSHRHAPPKPGLTHLGPAQAHSSNGAAPLHPQPKCPWSKMPPQLRAASSSTLHASRCVLGASEPLTPVPHPACAVARTPLTTLPGAVSTRLSSPTGGRRLGPLTPRAAVGRLGLCLERHGAEPHPCSFPAVICPPL